MQGYEKRQERIDSLTIKAINARGIERALLVGLLRFLQNEMQNYMANSVGC